MIEYCHIHIDACKLFAYTFCDYNEILVPVKSSGDANVLFFR